ncbi:MAG TPA: TIGR03086 family metal-binding protein [Candidatus Sulfotelmatobacter sp.]|nr:TIGR03086 family metal-binding protein [Candidatus Sulfotelmatobacter sp.]
MDMAEAFGRASDGFVLRAADVREDQWRSPTPCSEWDVRALVNHVAVEWLWVPEMMAGKNIADVGDRFEGDVLGSNPQKLVEEARLRASAALSAAGAAERIVHLSFGDTPASDYAMQMTADAVIHTWDLARAIGADERLDSALVDLIYGYLQGMAETWRAAGAFGPVRTTDDPSTQAKLIALTGR